MLGKGRLLRNVGVDLRRNDVAEEYSQIGLLSLWLADRSEIGKLRLGSSNAIGMCRYAIGKRGSTKAQDRCLVIVLPAGKLRM